MPKLTKRAMEGPTLIRETSLLITHSSYSSFNITLIPSFSCSMKFKIIQIRVRI